MKTSSHASKILRLAAAIALLGHGAAASAQALDDAALQELGTRFDAIQPRGQPKSAASGVRKTAMFVTAPNAIATIAVDTPTTIQA